MGGSKVCHCYAIVLFDKNLNHGLVNHLFVHAFDLNGGNWLTKRDTASKQASLLPKELAFYY